MTRTLPSFPVDTGTLNVILDSLDQGYIGNGDDGPIRAEGTFGILDVLHLFSGPAADDPSPLIYSRDDLIAALIHEILSLRTPNTEETSND